MASYTDKLKLFKYDPEQDGENLFSIHQALNENWDKIDENIIQRNIGEIVTSTLPLNDAGLHLLDGSLILGDGIYGSFVDYISSLYGDGTNIPNYFCTEDEFQSSLSTYGVCGKFVYDNVNDTVRLPKITGIVEGTIDINVLGDLVEAGLPNITGYINTIFNRSYPVIIGGAFNIDGITAQRVGSTGTPLSCSFFNARLDASSSNPIYGNSDTVQPQTIKCFMYIVIATYTKTDIQVDIDNIATDLNGKLDVDCTNLTTTGSNVISGLAMPSGRYIDLTLGATGSTYTAPANGWFCIHKRSNGTNQFLSLQSYANGIISQVVVSISGVEVSTYLPVRKGDQMGVYYNMGGQTNLFRFVYAEGAE